jgi:AcrR family transcriptional regulator
MLVCMERPRTRLPADERRRRIIDVALQALARDGFEGLRTRDVAASAKINTATLHHYFPTKEALVAAVAERLAERLRAEQAPAPRRRAGESDALHALRQQFATVAFYARERPELVAAYREIAGRSCRDPEMQRLLGALNDGWRESVAAVIRRGREEKVFRADCDPLAVADLVVAASWGSLVLLQLSSTAYQRSCRALERGLLTHPA